ncbi:MAG: TatD family hydrolase [Christensenellaceae bacterium]|jgi:TatD DNase family protein|nr:TatD family hydrolase [Christensenellaceae bacterium]
MRLFDTHAHYCDERFDADREAVLASLPAAGVTRVLEVACCPGDFDKVTALSARHAWMFAALGIHPHYAAEAKEADIETLRSALTHPKAVALGEIGLDYYYDFAPRALQRHWFTLQLELARQLNKPVILHVRDAYDDALHILRAQATGLRGVMHCFSGDAPIARACLDLGLYVAFGGAVTFKNGQAIAEAARAVPLERLLIETDCPYMAPVPHRGKRNDSTLMPHTLARLAELKGISPQELAEITYKNAHAVFGLMEEE